MSIMKSLLLLEQYSPSMSCSSDLDGLWDGKQEALQLLFNRVLVPGFVPNSILHSCNFFFSNHLVRVQVVHSYRSADTTIAGKQIYFIRSDFHMINNLSLAAHTFPMHILTLLSVDEILLPRYVNWSTNFKVLPLTGFDDSFKTQKKRRSQLHFL